MLHKTFTATTEAIDTERGTFEALVSAWKADREGDTISPLAFDRTVAAWRESGKRLPLLWEHSSDVVGHIDPESMRATADGLVASGEIDRESDKGPAAWRMVKAGSAGFSIGFMSESESKGDRGSHIIEVDLLEISITSRPMHAATRALSWKNASEAEREREMLKRAARDAASITAADAPAPRPAPVRVASFRC